MQSPATEVFGSNAPETAPQSAGPFPSKADCPGDPVMPEYGKFPQTSVNKKYVVWIVGSSLVYWGKARSVELGNENLEFNKDFVELFWKGIRGMKWESLLDTIELCKSKYLLPEFIIIHLGSNDIKFSCSKKLLVKILADLDCIQRKFPNCKIIFSELLCRLVWRGLRWEEGEKERSLVNEGIRNFLGKDNCIQHLRITKKIYLFRNDGVHLSDIGNDYLLEDLRLKIKQNTL